MLTFDSKYMLGPHLFKFRQLLCSSTAYHVMLKVKLFRVIPQKAIPQNTSIKGILFLLIPNALLQDNKKIVTDKNRTRLVNPLIHLLGCYINV